MRQIRDVLFHARFSGSRDVTRPQPDASGHGSEAGSSQHVASHMNI